MANPRDAKTLARGLQDLLGASLTDVASANRRMTQPLLDAISKANVSGNDKADLRALRDSLPALFDQMDDGPIADWAAGTLMQTYAIGRTAAVPEDMGDELDSDTESLQDQIRAPG